MYVFDMNIFLSLGHFSPKIFPSIWKLINTLVEQNKLWSVREVLRELEKNSHTDHIASWVEENKAIFKIPTKPEHVIVADIFKLPQFQGLIKRTNILKGLPVADPFVVASAKVYDAYVVTQEKHVKNGARIPTVCEKFGVKYINLEQFFEKENIKL